MIPAATGGQEAHEQSHIAPVILGGGERLLENVGDPKLEPVKVVESPAVTHVKCRIVR